MRDNMKKHVFWGGIFLVFVFTALLVAFSIEEDNTLNGIFLEGERVMHISNYYEEPGFKAIDNVDGDLTNQVVVNNNIDYERSGTYEITYFVSNSRNENYFQSRFVVLENSLTMQYKKEYDLIDGTMRSWWSANKKDHVRPLGGYKLEELLPLHATFLGNDEPVLYLTFDEGSNDTYVSEIVDVLNANDVKATFFLCRKFILNNPELILKIVDTGHSVGNHTSHHLSMPTLANKDNFEKFLKEIKEVEEAFSEITGKEIDKVYRDPRGEWSLRSLAIMKDLGYSTYFYSADYLDWNGEVSKDMAFQKMMERYHNGAIYLLHPQNKGNYLALDSFIKEMKNLGYSFGLVKDISFSN